MLRRALSIIGAVVLAAGALLVLAVLHYKPSSWRSSDVPAVAGRADPQRLRADVESFPPFRSRASGAPLVAMETLVRARLESLGWQVSPQEVRSGTNPHRTRSDTGPVSHNLLATRDLDPTTPRVLVAAHLDAVSPSPGADDDGSGVAVMLELARLLSPEVARHVQLCFFNEEEDGLFGSYTFVGALSREERKQVRAAYVMDMVGAYDTRPHSQTYPAPLSWLAPDRGDFLSVIALTDADAELQSLHGARERVAPGLPLEVLEAPRALAKRLPDLWRSDHAPFWEAGIPAIFFTDTGNFRSRRYHTANDVADVLDYGQMARLTELLIEVIGR